MAPGPPDGVKLRDGEGTRHSLRGGLWQGRARPADGVRFEKAALRSPHSLSDRTPTASRRVPSRDNARTVRSVSRMMGQKGIPPHHVFNFFAPSGADSARLSGLCLQSETAG